MIYGYKMMMKYYAPLLDRMLRNTTNNHLSSDKISIQIVFYLNKFLTFVNRLGNALPQRFLSFD